MSDHKDHEAMQEEVKNQKDDAIELLDNARNKIDEIINVAGSGEPLGTEGLRKAREEINHNVDGGLNRLYKYSEDLRRSREAEKD